jgi:hypothetical protein
MDDSWIDPYTRAFNVILRVKVTSLAETLRPPGCGRMTAITTTTVKYEVPHRLANRSEFVIQLPWS